MPVFHTKTIESILEPVAQQVSRLVVFHEEAEDGNAMPDLTQSVHAVKLAVDNLVKIGYETTNTSQDEILKQDMPPALQRVEQAADWLLEASKHLTGDPYSAPARKKLIEGSRGILQGTSDLLLAFDESEVRKIIAQCKAVMDYLNIAEVVENLTDLITFVKNISPGLTRMSKQVDDREKELTNQAHRTILQQCLEKIRELTPILISSIKVHVNQISSNSSAVSESRKNRDYVCSSMCKQLQEIIRVLQLTSSEPDETTGDDANDMRNCAADIVNKLNAAHDWLADPQAAPGGIGDRAINDMLASALRAADRCPDPEAQQEIQKAVSDIKAMMDALSELRANGQGDTPQAHALAKSIEQKLGGLVDLINDSANNVEKAGARATARTLQGRLEAAKAWLHAPTKKLAGMDGEAAARKVIADSRTLAHRITDGATREDLLRLCDEAERQLDDLCLHCQHGTANTPQARALAHALSSKLAEIEAAVNQAVNDKVVDVFLDVNGPLKALSAAANAPKDTPHREEVYEDKSDAFSNHSLQLAESAALVAYSSSTQNKSTLDQINHTAKQVAQLAPQVVTAGKIVLVDPSEEAAQEHFELMKKQWADNSDKLRTLVDENTDPLTFIKSTEAAMIKDTGNVESSIIGNEPHGIVDNAANIARRANRLIQLAQQEADNSEDPAFKKDIGLVSDRLKSLMPEMIKNAKTLTYNPRDDRTAETWRTSNNGLLDTVRDMRVLMEGQQMTLQPLLSPTLPDLTDLRLSEEAPPRPPLPAEEVPPPRPPSPDPVAHDQDAELERVFKDQPQENQPILMAAHNLHQEVRHWESSDNELVQAAKQMALLMAKLSEIVRGEGGTKKDLIDIAKQIAEASEAVTRLAKGLAAECTDKRVRTNLLQVCERIPTIGTQLKILSTVKATMLGSQGSQEDDEATEMLVGNAQNLMQSVKDVVHSAEGASIKIRVQSGYSIRWVRRRPWYA